jgi:hypothetical protein
MVDRKKPDEQSDVTTAEATREATGAATPTTQEGGEQGAVAFPYAAAGAAFTNWFNDKLLRLPNTSIMLGTKRVHVVELHEDGRLEVELDTEALEPEQQFVAFEAIYLDQLVRKIAALGL